MVLVLGCGSSYPDSGFSGSGTEVWPGEASEEANDDASTSSGGVTSAATNDSATAAGSDSENATSAATDATSNADDGLETGESNGDASETDASNDSQTSSDDGSADTDASESSTGDPVDAGILDVTIYAYDDCEIVTEPASITVPAGTDFTVRWHNAASSAVEVDIAKIDPFNQVPIILGFEPGTSYHDDIRQWCGDRFTGTFSFRITSCYEPHYLDVDCGG